MKVTGSPTVEGFTVESTESNVGSKLGAFTVCVGSDPVLGLKFPSPLNAAVTVCCPAASVAVTNWAP